MTEYSTNNRLAASCISIAEELEAHVNSRAYTDEDGNLVILDSDEEPTDDMEYRGLYDFIESARDVEIVARYLASSRGQNFSLRLTMASLSQLTHRPA